LLHLVGDLFELLILYALTVYSVLLTTG